ncbi:M23 family metallopeptidase [Rhodococcus sp. ACPA4]|uniref:M23 family metallopeptidase n=1 Tax=Rhodococcus sp. ACPA4 TaxID=2028571 RepID=UPI00211C431B|nr:M23 family metallopeptidase [Rhodococcus sp. ACPA4]
MTTSHSPLAGWAIAAAVMTLVIAGCSSSIDTTGPTVLTTSTIDSRGGIPRGYPTETDVTSPLVISALGPNPIPVTGTDGMLHVAYEIEVLNFSPRPATITKIETLAGGPDGTVVSTLDQGQVSARSILVGNFSWTPFTEIPVGRTVLMVLDDEYESPDDVPSVVTHRLTATFGQATPEDAASAARYPDNVTQFGGTVMTSTDLPVVIGPPLAGDSWVVGDGCCGLSQHRAGMMAVGGRINGTERFAVDWLRIDPDAVPLSRSRGGGSKNEDYFAYGAPLLAVADGTVVAVVSGEQDQMPQQVPKDMPFDQLGGNYVIIDIGNGNYAFYAHLKPMSATVNVGDLVTTGQVIGNLGNSGNTSEAHLHFHVSRAAVPLSGDNVPYEIDSFTFVGSAATGALVKGPNEGDRTDQLPLDGAVVNFPPVP